MEPAFPLLKNRCRRRVFAVAHLGVLASLSISVSDRIGYGFPGIFMLVPPPGPPPRSATQC